MTMFHDIEQLLSTLTEELYKVSITKEAIARTLAKHKEGLAMDTLKANHLQGDLGEAMKDLAIELPMDVKDLPLDNDKHLEELQSKLQVGSYVKVDGWSNDERSYTGCVIKVDKALKACKVQSLEERKHIQLIRNSLLTLLDVPKLQSNPFYNAATWTTWLILTGQRTTSGVIQEDIEDLQSKLQVGAWVHLAKDTHVGSKGLWQIIWLDGVRCTVQGTQGHSQEECIPCVDVTLVPAAELVGTLQYMTQVNKQAKSETIKVPVEAPKESYRFKLGDEVLVKPYQRKGFITHTRSYCIGKANQGMERCERDPYSIVTEYEVESTRPFDNGLGYAKWDWTGLANYLELIKAGPLYWVGQKVQEAGATSKDSPIYEVVLQPTNGRSKYQVTFTNALSGDCVYYNFTERELQPYAEPQPKFMKGHYVKVHGHYLVKDGSKGEIVNALENHKDRYVVKFYGEPYDGTYGSTLDTINTWCHEHELERI